MSRLIINAKIPMPVSLVDEIKVLTRIQEALDTLRAIAEETGGSLTDKRVGERATRATRAAPASRR